MSKKNIKNVNYWSYPALSSKNRETFPHQSQVAMNEIMNKVCKKYGMTKEVIKGRSRLTEINEPRQIFCYLAHKVLNLSSTSVGSYLNRDHATILNACKRVSNYMEFDKEYREKVNEFI